jgi:hypothetical protein
MLAGTVVRRNLSALPKTTPTLAVGTVNSSGFGQTPTRFLQSGVALPDGRVGVVTRLTVSAGGTTSASGDLLMAQNKPLVEPGRTYAGSVWVRSTAPLRVRAAAQWLTVSGSSAGATVGQPVTLTPGVWARLSVVGAAPGEANRVRLDIDSAAQTPYGADLILDADMILIEQSSTISPFFDGATEGADLMRLYETLPRYLVGEPGTSGSGRWPAA